MPVFHVPYEMYVKGSARVLAETAEQAYEAVAESPKLHRDVTTEECESTGIRVQDVEEVRP